MTAAKQSETFYGGLTHQDIERYWALTPEQHQEIMNFIDEKKLPTHPLLDRHFALKIQNSEYECNTPYRLKQLIAASLIEIHFDEYSETTQIKKPRSPNQPRTEILQQSLDVIAGYITNQLGEKFPKWDDETPDHTLLNECKTFLKDQDVMDFRDFLAHLLPYLSNRSATVCLGVLENIKDCREIGNLAAERIEQATINAKKLSEQNEGHG